MKYNGKEYNTIGELGAAGGANFQGERASKLKSIGVDQNYAERISLLDNAFRSGISLDNPAIVDWAKNLGAYDENKWTQLQSQSIPNFKPGSQGGAPSPYDFKGGNPDFNLAPGTTETITRQESQTGNQLNALQSQQPQTPSFALTGGNLNTGSRGDNVKQLQSMLGIISDGIYGPQTKQAVIEFQKKNGLTPDGIVGPATTAALAKQGQTNQTLKQGQIHPDGSGIVNFDSNTGKQLAQGGTTPSIAGQIGAISGTNNTTAPTSPTTGSTGGIDQSALENQYQSLLGLSKEELAAQKQETEAQNNIKAQENALRQGVQNVGEQPIAMSFISGQQADLEKRNVNLQIPLQEKLANAQRERALAQQKRQASLDAVQFSLDRSDKAKDRATTLSLSAQERADKLASESKDEAFRQATLAETTRSNKADENNARITANKNSTTSGDKTTVETNKKQNALTATNTVLTSIDEAIGQISSTNTGFAGNLTRQVGGTPAYNLNRTIDTIKSNIGFQALQAMREASPTGGALGQVAVQELNMLQATLGSLDIGQSATQLKANLTKIKTHFNNLKANLDKAGTSTTSTQSGGGSTSTPAGNTFKILN